MVIKLVATELVAAEAAATKIVAIKICIKQVVDILMATKVMATDAMAIILFILNEKYWSIMLKYSIQDKQILYVSVVLIFEEHGVGFIELAYAPQTLPWQILLKISF